MICDRNTILSGCLWDRAAVQQSIWRGSPDAHLSFKKYIVKIFFFCWSSIFFCIYPVNHFYSCRWGSGVSDSAQAFPEPCSYPTVRAKMQMKSAWQALTGSWKGEEEKYFLTKQEFTSTSHSTNGSMHPSTHLGLFSNTKDHVLSLSVRLEEIVRT